MSTQLPQRFGKYILLNKIAMGGMAEIYRAKTVGAEGFEKELAIKRILPHFTEDESFVKMFIDEATIAAKLHHANIVQIFDFDMIEGSYYIAMEYIEGKDVKRIIDYGIEINKPLNIFQSVHIIIEVCKGLHYAHTKKHKGKPLNIIHRDISPHNVMVSFNGEVKLMDFGIAKAASRSTKTRAGTVKGKCAYMSPEQARGKNLDPRSDLFAIGIVLWEMVTYRRLFLGDSDFETLSNVLKAEVPPPSKYNPQIPKDLERIIFKSLAKDRDERYKSVAGFLKELNQFFYSHVVDIDSISLSNFMQDLFTEDIRALAEMAASERTGFMDVVREEQKAERESSQPRPQRIVRTPSRPQLKPVKQPSPQPVKQQPTVSAEELATGGIEADATLPMSGVEEYMQKMGVPMPGQEEPQRTMAISPEQIKSAGTPQQQQKQNYPSQPQLRPVNQPAQQYQQNQAYPPQQMMSQHNFPQQQGYHPQYTPAPVQTAHAEEGGRGRSLVLFFIIFAIICGLAGTAAYIYFGDGTEETEETDDTKKNETQKPKTVKVTFNVTPSDATVTVADNKLSGPPYVYEGEPGKEVVLKISRKGYRGVIKSFTPDETKTISYSLTRVVVASEISHLTLKAPVGSQVKINGKVYPHSGVVTYKGVKKDKLSIVVFKPGYILARKSLVLTKKKEEITMELVRFKGTATIRYTYERRKPKTHLTINGRTQRRRPPINLKGLSFGSKLTVKLTRDGYDPFEKTYLITQNDQQITIPALQKETVKANLTVNVTPANATVAFNGKPVTGSAGKFSLANLKLGQQVTVMVTAPGHLPSIQLIKVDKQQTAIQVVLRRQVVKKLAQLIIDANVKCLVFLNGGFVGATPHTLRVKPGRAKVVVKNTAKNVSKTYNFVLQPGDNKTVYARF